MFENNRYGGDLSTINSAERNDKMPIRFSHKIFLVLHIKY